MSRIVFCALLHLALLGIGVCYADLTHEVVHREIEINGPVAKHLVRTTLRNDGADSVSSMHFAMRGSDKLGDIFVAAEGAKTKPKPLRWREVEDAENMYQGCACILYEILFPNPISAGEKVDITFAYDLVNAVNAAPSEIREGEDQYFRFVGNHYFFSAYPSKKTTTVVRLGSSIVTSRSTELAPTTQEGSRLILGPYENVKRFSYSPMFVRFKDNRGFLVAHSVLKEFYVSHWGNIGIHEEYKLENRGAKHVNRWSRIDYVQDVGRNSPNALGNVWATLPKDARNVDYRDLIGNITTSRLRRATKRGRAVQFFYRYPLLGGWKNHFWFTYDVMLKNFVNSAGSSHIMKVPFTPSFDEDILCESLRVSVVLPEGASNIQVMAPESIGFDVKHSVGRRTLNYIGRPSIMLTKGNLRSHSPHGSTLYISYDYSIVRMLWTPVIVVMGIFVLFASILFLNHVLSEGSSEAQNSRAFQLVARLSKLNSEISSSYEELQAILEAINAPGDFSSTEERRLSLEASIQQCEDNLRPILSELNKIGFIAQSRIDPVMSRYSWRRKTYSQQVKMKRMFVERKLSENDFSHELNKTIFPMLDITMSEVDDFVYSLAESLY